MSKYFPSQETQPWLSDDLLDDTSWGPSPERERPTPAEAMLAATRVEGYLTPNWFGPFLLGPIKRLGRGWC